MEYLIIYVVGGFLMYGFVYTILIKDNEDHQEAKYKMAAMAGLVWPAIPIVVIGALLAMIVNAFRK